jgi:hypothetical protein
MPLADASPGCEDGRRGLASDARARSIRGGISRSEIDAGVLPELPEQHLKDLGVSLGHRLKMLRSIQELAGAVASVWTTRLV